MDNNPMNINVANPVRSLIDAAHGLQAGVLFTPQTLLAADLNCCC